jgi:AraC-like DNA-binding protein
MLDYRSNLDFVDFLTTGLLFLSLLLCLSLVLKPAKRNLNNKLFALAIGIINFQLFHTLAINNGLIISIPFLVRLLSPFLYLFAPLMYLYVKKAINGKPALTKIDYLHFLPALIHFIDLIPFFLLPTEERRLVAEAFHNDFANIFFVGHGWVYQPIHVVIRGTLAIIYTSYALFLTIRWCKFESAKGIESAQICQWLTILSGCALLLSLSHSIPSFRIILFDGPGNYQYSPIDFYCTIVSLMSIMCINLFLFLKQQLVFKFEPDSIPQERLDGKPTLDQAQAIGDIGIDLPQRDNELEQVFWSLEELILRKELFRNKTFDVKALVKLSQLKEEQIRAALKLKGFYRVKDYINKHRVEYVKKCIKKGELKTTTLESLALEAGFNSRITFYRAFQKFENITPTDLKQQFEQI